ncbi:MAG TPA: DPP IV N-terminal domain-containing protein, partial [Tepidisphaeraceae bacterium]
MRAFLVVLLVVSSLAAAANVYRDRVEPHWFANETQFWYRVETGSNTHEFVRVDAEHGTRAAAFDHARLAAALAKQLGHPIAADQLPIYSLNFDQLPKTITFSGEGSRWHLNTADYSLQSAPGADAEAALAPIDSPHPSRNGGAETNLTFEDRTPEPVEIYWLPPSGERMHYATLQPRQQYLQHTFAGHVWLVTDEAGRRLAVFEAPESAGLAIINGKASPATRPAAATPARSRRRNRGGMAGVASPDGKWAAVVKDGNLFLQEKNGPGEFLLGADGKPGDAYSGAVWWSPDSRSLVAMRVEAGQEHKIYEVESSPADQVQPKLRALDYLKPGDKIDHPRPQLFHIDPRQHVPVKEDLFPNPWSIDDVRWSADSSRFTFVYNQRGHQAVRVIEVDARSGDARAIIDEHSDTFIDYSGKFFCHWLGDDELIWMSERDGWNHLWLYDARAGKVKNLITPGDWPVQRVLHVDAQKRQVWFTAGGVRPGQDPYYAHFCRVNFDGTGFVVLTEGDGNHRIDWSPGRPFFLDTWSRVDQPPTVELRSSNTGKLIVRLEQADAGEVLSERHGRWPERFVAKGRDGTTDIYGILLLPRDFEPSHKYPVVEQVYAGPQAFYTPKSFRPDWGTMQRIADRGMIVVQADGMGTSGRSKRFHDVCWKNLKDAGFDDRIAWIEAAAAAHPQMDLSRVGIYGGSAGGQNALAALLWHHDFYKVAVADCGCHDNRMDKIWWN